MKPENYNYFRKNASDIEKKPKDVFLHHFNLKQTREILSASVRSVDSAIKKLIKGKSVKTRYGTWTAEPKKVDK